MKNKFNWKNYVFYLKNELILSEKLINLSITNFFNIEVSKLPSNSHIMVLFRIVSSDNIHKTLGTLKLLNAEDIDYYKAYINNILSYKQNEYNDIEVSKIVFSYGIREGLAPENTKVTSEVKSILQNYKHYKLPITMDPLQYGNPINVFNVCDSLKVYIIQASNGNVFNIEVTLNTETGIITNKVKAFKQGMLTLTYEDTQTEGSKFIRTINKNKYLYNSDGQLELFYVQKPTKYISTLQEGSKIDSNFITLDIETRLVDQKERNLETEYRAEALIQVPYLISYFDGKLSKSFYLTDYNNNSSLMMQQCIKSLLVPEYDGYKIYIHNLAGFDAVFLMKELIQVGQMQPIINKGKIVYIKFKGLNASMDKPITLQFLDSYQLLLASLSSLGKAFQCEVNKGLFPHKLANQIDMLNYIGRIPNIEYFSSSTTLEEYSKYWEYYINQGTFATFGWNFKEEAIKYCINDCISLHEIITKFSIMIWDLFHVNITKYPTISSLAYAIFRTHFLKKDTVPMISGQVFNDIKESYTGGAVDMYIPSNIEADVLGPDFALKEEELLYCYDVNSLYPYVMKHKELPTGNVNYFEGNILQYKPDALGFFYVKVTAPNSLEHPIIQTHIKNMTISPLGTWEMMIYSEEMLNALKFGYKFEVLRGYFFDGKEIIFEGYISKLYEIKQKYDKNHPMYFIAKILMNSLYGRFGMDYSFSNTKIYEKDKFENMIAKISAHKLQLVEEIGDIGDTHYFVSTFSDKLNTILDSKMETHNTNVAIASAITALARVEMAKFKNNPLLKLYYTDTDSIFINLPPNELELLYPNAVGKDIGQLKLEYKINKAVFLGPKAYYLEPFTGDKPIIKIKGLNKEAVNTSMLNELSFSRFYSLLFKNGNGPISQNVIQTKWFKNISEGSIKVLEQSYEIKHNNNKRQLIYNDSNRLIGTKPYVITDHSNPLPFNT